MYVAPLSVWDSESPIGEYVLFFKFNFSHRLPSSLCWKPWLPNLMFLEPTGASSKKQSKSCPSLPKSSKFREQTFKSNLHKAFVVPDIPWKPLLGWVQFRFSRSNFPSQLFRVWGFAQLKATPLKTNMSPENRWLEDVFPTEMVTF